jgi:hypothetical protein
MEDFSVNNQILPFFIINTDVVSLLFIKNCGNTFVYKSVGDEGHQHIDQQIIFWL